MPEPLPLVFDPPRRAKPPRHFADLDDADRAAAVADVARSVGAVVDGVTGYGESQPAASNATAKGMAKNRRVEVLCKKG